MAPLDVLLLLALPASGKSELRRYLGHLEDGARTGLGVASPTGLDDYPYVHLMRRISRELRARGAHPVFFGGDDLPMLESRDWGTLIHLLNEDFADLYRPEPGPPDRGGSWLLDRLDRARARAGADPPFAALPADLRSAVVAAIDDEAADLGAALHAKRGPSGTVVIEFARGGAEGALPPLPYGYQYSLSILDPQILRRASILYVWVTPAESRRRNRERARPDGDASILFHGVPEVVMRHDYGTDDMGWLLERSDRPGTVRVDHREGTFHLPAARFDNRDDLTSFLRQDPAAWPSGSLERLHARLAGALASLGSDHPTGG